MKTIPLPARADIDNIVRLTLAEDVGSGDITAQLIAADTQATATIISREAAVICGLAWADAVLQQLDPDARINWQVSDGATVEPGQILARLTGRARILLTAERNLLNFLQTLSGTATLSRRYADLVGGTKVRLLDTRKTIPGLRLAQKYAVAVGGCSNHRLGLYDAFLIKENHIRACGSITAAVMQAQQLEPDKSIEVEIERLEQLAEALTTAACVIMLDNFSLPDLRQAVQMNNGRKQLEASGGIDQSTVVAVASTGVDFISVGALTKDCKAVDLSLLFA